MNCPYVAQLPPLWDTLTNVQRSRSRSLSQSAQRRRTPRCHSNRRSHESSLWRHPQAFRALRIRMYRRGTIPLSRLYYCHCLRLSSNGAPSRPQTSGSPRHHRGIPFLRARPPSSRNVSWGATCRRRGRGASSKTILGPVIFDTNRTMQRFRVIQIQHAAFFVCGDFFYVARVRPHNGPRTSLQRGV